MRRIEAGLAVALAFCFAALQQSCALTGKPKPAATVAAVPPQPKPVAAKPAAPPESLSVAQTQVQLPPVQPVNMDALPQPKEEEPAAAPAAPRPARRTPAAPPPKPETSAPATPPAEAAPAPAPALAPVQEMLSADEKRRFQQSAEGRRAEIRQLLKDIKSHRLTTDQSHEVKRIQSLVAQSEDVERTGDMRQADALAERGLILAREMTSGK